MSKELVAYILIIIIHLIVIFGYFWSEKRREKIEKEILEMDNKIIEEFIKK